MPYHFGNASKEELSGQVFPPIPDGTYIFVVKDIDEHESEVKDDKGNPTGEFSAGWKVTLRLADDYNGEKYKGFTRSIYPSIEEGKRGRLFEFLQACGITSQEITAGVDVEPANLIGKRVQANVRRKGEWNGQPSYDISRLRPEGFEESKTALATSGGSKRRGI